MNLYRSQMSCVRRSLDAAVLSLLTFFIYYLISYVRRQIRRLILRHPNAGSCSTSYQSAVGTQADHRFERGRCNSHIRFKSWQPLGPTPNVPTLRLTENQSRIKLLDTLIPTAELAKTGQYSHLEVRTYPVSKGTSYRIAGNSQPQILTECYRDHSRGRPPVFARRRLNDSDAAEPGQSRDFHRIRLSENQVQSP